MRHALASFEPHRIRMADKRRQTLGFLAVPVYGLFFLGLLYTLYLAREFLMPLLFGVILSFIFRPILRILMDLRLPRQIAATFILATVVGILTVGAATLARPARRWLETFPDSMRSIQQRIMQTEPAEQVTEALHHVNEITNENRKAKGVEIQAPGFSRMVLNWTSRFFVSLSIALVTLYFLLLYGDYSTRQFIQALFPNSENQMILMMVKETEQNISHYFFTIALINACLGILVAGVMVLLGMPNPVLWGVLGGTLNFIPYIGAFIAIVVLTLAAFIEFQSISHVLLVPASYWLLTCLETWFVTPLILGKNLTLNPLVIFLSFMFWGWLWGVGGMFVAIPILMALRIVCEHVRPLKPLGHFLSHGS